MAKKKVSKKTTKKVVKKSTKEKPNYNWDKWLNGKRHTCKSGSDFVCTPTSFVHYARKRGIVAGKKVSAEFLDNGDVILQAAGKYTGVQTDPLQLKSKKSSKKTTKKVSKKKKTSKKTTKKKKV